MRVTINSINLEITEALRARIEKKIAKLDRFLAEDEEVRVRLKSENETRNSCEITIDFAGAMLRAEETGEDMYACIDKDMDKIVRQIRKHRTKLEKRLRAGAFERAEEAVPEEEEEPQRVVRTKRFAVKPMSVDDAIAQMEMLGHTFFLFLNDETGAACVVYKRESGDYGLLEPINA
ncbi:MAG: ribosome-associated translation inhibitor RaiA [Clostridia bacterium]|nr:ribosome-associated translation inhibitor RaiA [Clostridia bacterium]